MSQRLELDPHGLVTPVRPFHKQQDATMIVDLKYMETVKSPEMSKSEKASKMFELDPHRLAESVDAYAREESPPPTYSSVQRRCI